MRFVVSAQLPTYLALNPRPPRRAEGVSSRRLVSRGNWFPLEDTTCRQAHLYFPQKILVSIAPSKPNNVTDYQGRLHILNCRSSPRLISTGQLNTLLCVHLRPIYQIVSLEPYSDKSDGRSYLRGGFTLRCLQRLSRPYLATQLCRWHDNWCTRGMSIPVLSY